MNQGRGFSTGVGCGWFGARSAVRLGSMTIAPALVTVTLTVGLLGSTQRARHPRGRVMQFECPWAKILRRVVVPRLVSSAWFSKVSTSM